MTNHRGAINPLPEGATAGELCKGGPNWDILANSFIDSNRIPDFIAEGRGHKSVRAFRGFQLEPGREKVRVGGLAPDTAARTYDMMVEVLYSISFYFYGA